MEEIPLLEQFYKSMCVEKQGSFRVQHGKFPYRTTLQQRRRWFLSSLFPNPPKSQVGNLPKLYGVHGWSVKKNYIWKHIKSLRALHLKPCWKHGLRNEELQMKKGCRLCSCLWWHQDEFGLHKSTSPSVFLLCRVCTFWISGAFWKERGGKSCEIHLGKWKLWLNYTHQRQFQRSDSLMADTWCIFYHSRIKEMDIFASLLRLSSISNTK